MHKVTQDFNVEKPLICETTTGQSPKQSTINKEDTTQIQALPLDTLEKSRDMLHVAKYYEQRWVQ